MKLTREYLIKQLSVLNELTNSNLSIIALEMLCGDLFVLNHEVLSRALNDFRKAGLALNFKNIMKFYKDGRLPTEEAFALLLNQSETIVCNSEALQAYNLAKIHVDNGDNIAGRMVFKEKYNDLVEEARNKNIPINFKIKLGSDVEKRGRALIKAFNEGKIDNKTLEDLSERFNLPEKKEVCKLLNKPFLQIESLSRMYDLQDIYKEVLKRKLNNLQEEKKQELEEMKILFCDYFKSVYKKEVVIGDEQNIKFLNILEKIEFANYLELANYFFRLQNKEMMFIDFKSCLNYFSQNVNQLKKDYANYLKMKELQQKIESTKRLNNEILIKKEGIKKMLMNEENK